MATAAVLRENIRLRRAFVMAAGAGEAVGRGAPSLPSHLNFRTFGTYCSH